MKMLKRIKNSVISPIGSIANTKSFLTFIKAADSNSILFGNLRAVASRELFICVLSKLRDTTTFSFPISELMLQLLPEYREYLCPRDTLVRLYYSREACVFPYHVSEFYFYFEFVQHLYFAFATVFFVGFR